MDVAPLAESFITGVNPFIGFCKVSYCAFGWHDEISIKNEKSKREVKAFVNPV